MKRMVALVSSLAILFTLAGCGAKPSAPAQGDAPEETYTIKMAMTQGDVAREESAEVTWAERFEEEVESKSDGRIQVEIYGSDQLGSADESLTGMLNGSLEMACLNINVLNNIAPQTMMLSCPALFENEAACDAVLSGAWGQAFFNKLAEDNGVRVLSAFCNGMRCFTSTDAPLTTVESAKGLTFRVMQSEICEKMVSAIGANPVPMAGSEMYTALQNGTVDGQENPPVNILNDKTYEVQKYMVMDKHIASIVTFNISEKYFKSMPEDLQAIVTDAADLVVGEAAQVCANLNAAGVEKLEGYGMSVYTPTEEELNAWHEAMRGPCVEFLVKQVGGDAVDELLAAIQAEK